MPQREQQHARLVWAGVPKLISAVYCVLSQNKIVWSRFSLFDPPIGDRSPQERKRRETALTNPIAGSLVMTANAIRVGKSCSSPRFF